jgi:hypothetical protein
MPVASSQSESGEQGFSLPGFDVTEAAWPCEDPDDLMCRISPRAREMAMAMLLDRGEVVITPKGGKPERYTLRHVIVGGTVTDMLKLVKEDEREAAAHGQRVHPHVAIAKPR